MINYYINFNPNSEGFHEIHEEDCSWLTLMEDPVFMGSYESIESAKKEALKHFDNVSVCHSCNMVMSVA